MRIHIHKIVTEHLHTSTRIRTLRPVVEQNFVEIHAGKYQEINLRITARYTDHRINNVNQWTYTPAGRELYALYINHYNVDGF